MALKIRQALPLPPESSGSEDALYEDKDVTVEVMRARGAGGQVKHFRSGKIDRRLNRRTSPARQQNRVGGSSHACTFRNHGLNARRAESTSGPSAFTSSVVYSTHIVQSSRTEQEPIKCCAHAFWIAKSIRRWLSVANGGASWCGAPTAARRCERTIMCRCEFFQPVSLKMATHDGVIGSHYGPPRWSDDHEPRARYGRRRPAGLCRCSQ